ncbi:MAG: flagellar biosynthetic protein FliR [Erysipelotrichaceae bacterium]
MSLSFTYFPAYMLVFVRLAACFLFNPVFARKNVPTMVKLGLVGFLTLLCVEQVQVVDYSQMGDLTLILLIGKEILIGFVLGFVFQIYQMMMFFVGDLLDFQFGLSMAKVFDPGTSIQVSAIGNYFQVLFIMLFFATNSHLLLIKTFTTTFQYLDINQMVSLGSLAGMMIDIFLSVFMMAIHLALPFIIIEFIVEVSMGILMKLIPQIHVFVINIQVKLLMGIGLLLVLVVPVSNFIDQYIGTMILDLQKVILQAFL